MSRTIKVKTVGARPAQGFSTGKAQQWILVCALVTGLIYAFRKLVEPVTPASTKTASKGKAAQLVGAGAPPPLETWAIGYGAAFLMLSVVALGAPELAASLALMATLGNLLTNGITLTADLTNLEGGTTAGASASSSGAASLSSYGSPLSQTFPGSSSTPATKGQRMAAKPVTKAAGQAASDVSQGLTGFGF